MTEDKFDEGRLTTDRETIRRWADDHRVAPMRTTETGTRGGSGSPYQLVPEDEQTGTMESATWDDFFRQVEDDELVVVYHGEGIDRAFEVLPREQAMSRAALDTTEIEERLMKGETVTSEITETTVIERTVVEHATIESDVVETELLDSQVVDAELLTRTIGGCNILDRATLDNVDHSRYDDMTMLEDGMQETLSQPVPVEVDVEEDWLVTRELLERATIESRIVDTDMTESDEVEAETLESSIEIEGLQQALIESDVIETRADPDEVIQSDLLESEFHEDDLVRTHLTQRRVVEDMVTEQKLIRGELTESELVFAETTSSTPIETAFVDSETLDADATPVGVTEYETAGGEGATAKSEPAGEDVRTVLTEEDEGKPVVDASGDTLGMIEEVRGETAYIDPDPGIVDRIKSKLGWGEADEDDYPLDQENVARVTDDEVELLDLR